MNDRMRSMRRIGRSSPGVRVLIRTSLPPAAPCRRLVRRALWSLIHSCRHPRRSPTARFPCPPARSGSTTRRRGSASSPRMTARTSSCTPRPCPRERPRPRQGTRLEFGVADGKRGLQALSVRVLEAPVSLAKRARKPADDMAIIVEDLVKLLDGIGGDLRRGRYPSGGARQEGRGRPAQGRR